MLTTLRVSNYAIIEKLEIDFSDGLTIITGETGAGKSILIGALSLLEGLRADSSVLMEKEKKCIVEAVFNIKKSEFKVFFSSNELDYSELTTVRREINPEGKSRAFINDTPVTLSILKQFTGELVDIHSQHETLLLGERNFQLAVVDIVAQQEDILKQYRVGFREWKSEQKKLDELLDREARAKNSLDYFQFQYNELDEAAVNADEQAELEKESEALNHSEEIKSGLHSAQLLLNGGETNLLSQLGEIRNLVLQPAKFKNSIEELQARINSSLIELKDIASELESISESIQYDPKRLERINDRLDLIYRLQKKHQVQSVPQLLEIQNALKNKIEGIGSLEAEISGLQKRVGEVRNNLLALANKISNNRKKAIPKLTETIHRMLKQLAMPQAEIKIEHEKFAHPELGPDGIDKIVFLFLPNKGGEFRELSKIASGGELSRLMLTIKATAAKGLSLPTIILDEIDSGVSGEVADKVGNIMKTMAQSMQVITITHLPQIASKGDMHYLVYKQSDSKTTRAYMREVNGNERVTEIAKMLSGEKLTDAAVENAKELLSVN